MLDVILAVTESPVAAVADPAASVVNGLGGAGAIGYFLWRISKILETSRTEFKAAAEKAHGDMTSHWREEEKLLREVKEAMEKADDNRKVAEALQEMQLRIGKIERGESERSGVRSA